MIAADFEDDGEIDAVDGETGIQNLMVKVFASERPRGCPRPF